MAVPKRKQSSHRRGNRRAHHAIGKPNLRPCSNCGTYGYSHRVCSSCGFYNGKQVIIPRVKKVKEEAAESKK
ncbi:MAG: 50S ribosomal protein L32 [Spirochaetia bacterium]|nr:50S ribosomal protein L32 [Spirochaetia bacterium]